MDIVSKHLEAEDLQNVVFAYRRAANILQIEDKKDGPHRASFDLYNMPTNEERDLWYALETVGELGDAFTLGDYDAIMTWLAKLRRPVDAFFEKVMVNAPEPDLRVNRLRMLARLRDTMHLIADFSKIQG